MGLLDGKVQTEILASHPSPAGKVENTKGKLMQREISLSPHNFPSLHTTWGLKITVIVLKEALGGHSE